jgi:hypothetical protein
MSKKVYRCNNCLKADKGMHVCGKCSNIHYCSVSCQKEDWSLHKQSCGNKLPKSTLGVICTKDDNLIEIRQQYKLKYSHIKEPHCLVCGDTEKECKLVRTVAGIFCEECEYIQLNVL